MRDDPKKPTSPDGAPKVQPVDPDAGSKSTISDVQDPSISGDGGGSGYSNTDEAQPSRDGDIHPGSRPDDLLN